MRARAGCALARLDGVDLETDAEDAPVLVQRAHDAPARVAQHVRLARVAVALQVLRVEAAVGARHETADVHQAERLVAVAEDAGHEGVARLDVADLNFAAEPDPVLPSGAQLHLLSQ